MALIDRCHLEYPFYGSRRIRDWLEEQGRRTNRKKVRPLMRTVALTAQFSKRNLSLANQAHKVYPYLLLGLEIGRPNQVWATNVTYLPMAGVSCIWSRLWIRTREKYFLEPVQHARCELLRRGPGGGERDLWHFEDLQSRSRQPIHQRRLHRHPQAPRHWYQHGRHGPMARQRLREGLWPTLKYEEVYLRAYTTASRLHAHHWAGTSPFTKTKGGTSRLTGERRTACTTK